LHAWAGERVMASMRTVVLRGIAPQVSLFWGPLFFTTTHMGFEKVDEAFEPLSPEGDQAETARFATNGKSVLLIVLEALRYDVLGASHQGKSIMPTLENLAHKGISFPRAYANSPETDYSQVTLLTGQFPLRYPERDLHEDRSFPHTLITDRLKKY